VKSANIRYLPRLDHLRGFAALLIVLYHSVMVLAVIPRGTIRDASHFWFLPRNPLTVLVQEGRTAVALFMVLSGFVFSFGCDGREVIYWRFIQNRVLRIYPLFLTALMVGTAALPALFTLRGMLQTLLFQANLEGSLVLTPFTSMFWAVSVEFQFYLLFPFLHRFIAREGTRWALALIVLALALRLFATICGASNARDISYWHMLGRIDQFVLGMLAGRIYLRIKDRQWPWGLLALGSFMLALSVLVGFSVAATWESTAYWKIGWPPVEGVAWATFIVTYVAFADRHSGKWSWPLEQLGTFSYSLYLWHFMVLTAMSILVPFPASRDPDRAALLYALKVVVPVLIPLAALSYHVIERPFLQMRVQYLEPRKGA
jgi:peptidoglycan/LPS O-acetylase OafA/YrhL